VLAWTIYISFAGALVAALLPKGKPELARWFALCVGVAGRGGPDSLVHCSPLFEPGDRGREEDFARARAHFQDFLRLVERLLREDPYRWFNFLPLNPPIPAGSPPSRA